MIFCYYITLYYKCILCFYFVRRTISLHARKFQRNINVEMKFDVKDSYTKVFGSSWVRFASGKASNMHNVDHFEVFTVVGEEHASFFLSFFFTHEKHLDYRHKQIGEIFSSFFILFLSISRKK